MMRSWYLSLLTLAVGVYACGDPAKGAATEGAGQPADALAAGERMFIAHCARCHGIGGGGGEGSNLRRPMLQHASDAADLFSVIRNGIPGTGMPANWPMNDREVRQVASYVASLGVIEAASLAGDPVRGKEIFDTTGLCATCHIVGGKGSSLARDLTNVGARRGAEYLREALLNPGGSRETMPRDSDGYVELLKVSIVTRAGEELEGMRINEDGFTIQIRDASNRFHSFRKADLLGVNKLFGESLMQSYEGVFSAVELDDLVAYLASLRGAP